MNKEKRKMYRESWRKNHPERFREVNRDNNHKYNNLHPERRFFTQKVYKLLKKGQIKKTPCKICRSKYFVQACTLSNVYEPLWLCDKHNKELHRKHRNMEK